MRSPRRRSFVVTLLLTMLASSIGSFSIGSAVTQEPIEPVRVAATVGMIGDVAAQVGGECAQVTSIMGSGVDPHVYQASARDVSVFQSAEIIFYGGYSLEGQLGEVLEGFSRRKPTVAVAEVTVPRGELITTDDAYGVDPHVWMDVSLWAGIVPAIARALGELRPECGDQFAANADRYVAQLGALHNWVGGAIATIPQGQRVLVTAHDAFSYYGRAYDIEVTGIQGISTESEAGVADIRQMARIVAERKVPAVFVESTINPRTVQAVVEAAGRLGHEIEIASQLYSDALGEQGTAGGTYIGMIYENTSNIVGDLGGEVPPLPDELAEWMQRWEPAAGEQR
ncbi:MAG: zinc ABC transporter substrate-binding protein [Trueperaceae bacterium]